MKASQLLVAVVVLSSAVFAPEALGIRRLENISKKHEKEDMQRELPYEMRKYDRAKWYKLEPRTLGAIRAAYDKNMRKFCWDTEIMPTCATGYKIGKRGKKYYLFAGAYWKRGEIREIHREVYSKIVDGFYSGNSRELEEKRKKAYSKYKPRARIFALANKGELWFWQSESKKGKVVTYWLRGSPPIKKLEDEKKKTPEIQARELWIKGRELMAENNYTGAIECFEQAKEKAPDYSPPYYRLGLSYEKTGDKDKALENYNKYLELIEGNSKKEKIRSKVQESIDKLKLPEQE